MKRAFKSFVEERDDKFTMELLLLPSALKEELLGLAHSSTVHPVSSASLFLTGRSGRAPQTAKPFNYCGQTGLGELR